MKKNVKYLGVAAAALLAVAPVAVTGVANAATIQVQGGTAQPSATQGTILANLTATNVASLKDGSNADTVAADLSATLNGQAITPKVFGDNKAYVVPANTTDYSVTNVKNVAVKTLKANTEYKLVVPQVGFTGLSTDAKANYTFNGGKLTVDPYGNSNVVPVVSSTFEIAQGNAYFTQNNTVVSGTTSIELGSVNTVEALASKIQGEVVAANTGSLTQSNKTALESQIKNALANAGVAVNANGSFVAPVTNFTVPYTAQFPNGSSATINVIVKVTSTTPSEYTDNGPQFALTANGEKVITRVSDSKYNLSLKQGTNFNANDLVKAFDVTFSKSNGAKLTTATVVSNNVNTAVPGNYQVVLSATNPAGVTNKVVVNVTVTSNGTTARTVKYVPGYNVFAWTINGNRATISDTKYPDGATVTTEGEGVTVGGVKYLKIANSDLYIQAQYVDGSYKPSTSNKGEESVSGVLTVKYDGKGKVGLTDANGKYTGQYVSKNSRWKVFAKKTINGREFYRIGNQKQWIPAQYSELAD
ncbi:SLAP domain-containing protein [Lactobacillus sp. PV034]|uniref:SLAP domain-containing protein n=1 Tax=Lactobacillus sp. PV034 TaxID=2594495 RepID=UPI00223FBA33|nr:SLAP domain-containing protein [Lactobacillus sp. PV034]QNQ81009.1 hypothetical protein FP432_05305 [Lactobacillus sp. PV034]